ncbi:MAG: HAD family hydrolase [Candidatus Melainabacteria bacterium]|nr:HAD family hydrolase [Candidatus Melainabacteria bacterium]
MRYSTILFDFDGTLTHSLPLWMRAYQFALSKYGINLPSDQVIEKCFYRPWEDLVSDFELPSIADFSVHVHTGLEAAMPEAILFDDVMHVLETCRESGITLGIVTSSTKTVVKKFLADNNMEGLFNTVITANDITNFKPHPEPVFKALAEVGGDAKTCLFVGDSSVDMLAAGNAGCHKALFLPDEHIIYYDFVELKTHEPHYVFHRYSELLTTLELAAANKLN